MDFLTIKINNWDKYQPRKDLQSLTWFRVQTDIFEGENYFFLKNEGMIIFLFLLTKAAKENTDTLTISVDFLSDKLKVEKTGILDALKKLELKQLVHSSVRNCTELSPTLHNNTIHNNTKELRNKNITTEPKNSVTVEKSKSEDFNEKLQIIKNDLIESWADTYPQEFLQMELKKARSWIIANHHKAPKKNLGRFLNSWFDRGWENYRKTLKSEPIKTTAEDILEMVRGFTND